MLNILKIYMIFIRKLVANLHDKNEHVIYIGNLRQTSDYRLFLKNVHRVIKFNQKAWLKSNIDMNTDLRKVIKSKINNFEKIFSS